MGTMWAELRADWLVATVRIVGVILGIAGTAIASPDAVRALGSSVQQWMTMTWWRLWAALGFHRIHQASGSVSLTSGAAGGVLHMTGSATGSVWSDDQDEQMRILRERTDNLDRALETLRIANQRELNELRMAIANVRSEHASEVERLRAAQEEQHRQNLRINARGLPFIGLAVVLSGLPDTVVANPWFGWPLLAAGLLGVVGAVVVGRGHTA